MKPSRKYVALKIGVAFISIVFAITAFVRAPQRIAGLSSVAIIVAIVILTVNAAVTVTQARADAELHHARPRPLARIPRLLCQLRHHSRRRIRCGGIADSPKVVPLADALWVTAYCDPALGHGMFYSKDGIFARFGITVKNTDHCLVRPTEVKDARAADACDPSPDMVVTPTASKPEYSPLILGLVARTKQRSRMNAPETTGQPAAPPPAPPPEPIPLVTIPGVYGSTVTIPARAAVRIDENGACCQWHDYGPGVVATLSAGEVAAAIAAGRPVKGGQRLADGSLS